MLQVKEIPSMEEGLKQEEFKNTHVPTNFVYADHVFKALELARLTGENIILWGKGGHGKSEMVNKYFADLGVKPYVKSLGSGTTIDALLGGIDLNLFSHGVIDHVATAQAKKDALDAGLDINDVQPIYSKKPGAIEYLTDNSFMNNEYVVLEEALDCPDFVLEVLKDILTSKEFRNGTQRVPLKTKMIVICTNKSRADFATDNTSLQALMERFVMEVKVEWPAYTQENYNFLFQESFGKKNTTLTYILGELAKDNIIISPRTAVKVLFGMEKGGTDYMQFVAEFTTEASKKIVKEAIKKYKGVAQVEELTEKVNIALEYLSKVNYKVSIAEFNIREVTDNIRAIKVAKETLLKIKVDDDLRKRVDILEQQWSEALQHHKTAIEELTCTTDLHK